MSISGLRDAHTHFFSRRFFELLASQAEPDPQRRRLLLSDVCERAGLELPAPEPEPQLKRWLEQLDANGVERAVSFASLPGELEEVAAACERSGGRLVPYCVLDPTAAAALELLERGFRNMGLRGVVLFPALHHYRLLEERCRPFLQRLSELGGVCVVHVGQLKIKLRDLLGLPRAIDLRYANPLDLVAVANAFPELRLVIPHFGAGMLRETLLLADQCPNVWIDSSSSNDWLRTQVPRPELLQVFAATLAVIGPERLLFGTDSSTFPRGWRDDIYQQQLAIARKLELDPAQQSAIFGGNLARLLGD